MDYIKLSQRFVNLPQWRWTPGMKTIAGDRVVAVYNGGDTVYIDSIESAEGHPYNLFPAELDTIGAIPTPGSHIGRDFSFRRLAQDQLPDLTDPATLGCITHLLRVAFRSGCAAAVKDYSGWVVDVESSDGEPIILPYRPSEAEAIYAAFKHINE